MITIKQKLCFLLLALALPFSVCLGWNPPYEEQVITLPAGVTEAWPLVDSARGINGIVLVTPLASETEDDSTGVWFFSSNQELYSIASYDIERIFVRVADVNGDGAGDIVVANQRSLASIAAYRIFLTEDIEKLLNNSSAKINQSFEGILPYPDFREITANDMTGDGLADLVLIDGSESTGSRLGILQAENNGDNGEISFVEYANVNFNPGADTGLGNNSKFFFGDFDGNSVEDIVKDGKILFGLEAGKFNVQDLPKYRDSITLSKATLLGVDDYDRDGVTEFLFYHNLLNIAELTSLNTDLQNYNQEYVFSYSSFGAQGIANIWLEDFDSDGDSDLAYYSSFNELMILNGLPDGQYAQAFEHIASPSGSQIEPLAKMDMNQDGETDWLYLGYDYLGEGIRQNVSLSVVRKLAPPEKLYLDKTEAAGLNVEMAGHAVALADYNADSFQDIFILNGSGPNALFANNGDGTFTDRAEEAGLSIANDGVSCAWGDYNDDGLPDLAVAGFWLPDKLFRNNGDGTFSDVSHLLEETGGHSNQRATSVCWGDFDRDGWLDLLLGIYDGPNMLWFNNSGQGFYTKPEISGIMTDDFKTESAILVDVNQDEMLDILSINTDGPNHLWRQSRYGDVLVDASSESGLFSDNLIKAGQSVAWGDINADGLPDLYLTRSQEEDLLLTGRPGNTTPHYQLDFSGQHGSNYGRMSSAIADFNEDGFTDLLIARSSRFGDFISNPADLLFFGDSLSGLPDFKNVTLASENPDAVSPASWVGLDRTLDSSLPVAADFDKDGDLDILYVNYLLDNPFDLFHGSPLPLAYLENQSQAKQTILVSLRPESNHTLIGTRVTVKYGNKEKVQVVSGGGGRIQTGTDLLFSIADGPGYADEIKIDWAKGGGTKIGGPIYPGLKEIGMPPVITPIDIPDQAPEGVEDSVSILVRVEDDSEIEYVYALLPYISISGVEGINETDTSNLVRRIDRGRIVTIIGFNGVPGDSAFQGIETSEPDVYRINLPVPAAGDSLNYVIWARDIRGNLGQYPENKLGNILDKEWLVLRGPDKLPLDLNGDGKEDIRDAIWILPLIGDNPVQSPTEEQLRVADVDRDGRLTIFDVLAIISAISSDNSGESEQTSPSASPSSW